MKALIYHGVNNLKLEDIPDPVQKPDEILVQVHATGICGSDMHAYHGHDERRPPPLILGHETAGIAQSGKYAGRPVTVNPLVTCGECEYCINGKDNLCSCREILSMPPREGAFAEWISIPEKNLVEIPEGFSMHSACMVEPLATSYRAIIRLIKFSSRPIHESKVLIIGGGAIGVGCLEILLSMGVPPKSIALIETSTPRLDACRKNFESPCFHPNEADSLDSSYDFVIDAVGNKHTHEMSSFASAPDANIIRIGLEQAHDGYDIRKHTLAEINLLGSYTYTFKDFRETARLVFEGRLGKFPWRTVVPFSEASQAFVDIETGNTPFAKIVLDIYSP